MDYVNINILLSVLVATDVEALVSGVSQFTGMSFYEQACLVSDINGNDIAFATIVMRRRNDGHLLPHTMNWTMWCHRAAALIRYDKRV